MFASINEITNITFLELSNLILNFSFTLNNNSNATKTQNITIRNQSEVLNVLEPLINNIFLSTSLFDIYIFSKKYEALKDNIEKDIYGSNRRFDFLYTNLLKFFSYLNKYPATKKKSGI